MRQTWESARLVYRAVDPDDEPFLSSLLNDAETSLNAQNYLAAPPGKPDAAKWRERMQNLMLGVIICLKAPTPTSEDATTNKPIPMGTIGLSASDAKLVHHRNCMLGVNLAPGYLGQGYGSEAIKWALHWGFYYANMHRIELGCFAWNPRAIQLYQRLGFVPEGVQREIAWFEGRYWDLHLLAMLRREWEERYGGGEQKMVDEGSVSAGVKGGAQG